jgi:NAD(P)-dependent dehydrogenase (short-subunit alcohol dehydrogenase family)
MSALLDFSNKRVLITGGTKGMGAATLRLMLERGATVATTARTPADDLPPGVYFVAADIGTREGIDAVVRMTNAKLNGIDILINNVGGSSSPAGGALALTEDEVGSLPGIGARRIHPRC